MTDSALLSLPILPRLCSSDWAHQTTYSAPRPRSNSYTTKGRERFLVSRPIESEMRRYAETFSYPEDPDCHSHGFIDHEACRRPFPMVRAVVFLEDLLV